MPKTFSAVALIVGAVWVVQGMGIVPTGSFMDGQPLWAVLGAILLVAGGAGMLLKRRRSKEDPDQPGS